MDFNNILFFSFIFRMVSLNANKRIVQQLTIAICLRRRMAAVKNAKVSFLEHTSILRNYTSSTALKQHSIITFNIYSEFINFNDFCLPFLPIQPECIYKGERYASGAEWSDPDDPCASFKCVAGVVTESTMQCYTPCNNPLSPRKGQCCSTCLGKFSIAILWIQHEKS